MSDTETAEPVMEQYLVTADAINITVGTKPNGRPETKRIMRGVTINALPDDERVITLLGMKSIVKVGSKAAERGARVTARMIAQTLGAADDPAAAPLAESVPLDASVQDTEAALA